MPAKTLIAYHGKKAEKTAILAQLQKHHDADELVKGQYWQNGKGCAVGCTIYGNNHALYEPKFGIPQILAVLEDRIFEGLPNGKAKAWPLRFMGAVKPGSDLSMVWPRFALWLLAEELPPSTKGYTKCTAALADVAALYREWCETGNNPAAARWAAAAAAARWAAAADADADAAAAANAAAAAANAANAAAAAAAAYVRMADKLVELLAAAPKAKKAA